MIPMRRAMGGDNSSSTVQGNRSFQMMMLTDNIGAVELTFRVYDENQLDMRFYFSQKETAREFRSYVNDIRNSLKDLTLNIGDVKVGSVGEKMT